MSAQNRNAPSADLERKELFRRLRLGGDAWIDMPLFGIDDAADMAEGFVQRFPQLFWNTPRRERAVGDVAFLSNVINRLKNGGREAAGCALRLVVFLEDKNHVA